MRFILSVAFKYLIPRWRQLSVSIISLVSVLVISLVVWLVVVFLSVTEGIEKNWIKQLVALNAPVRIVPTDAYYNSYYYQIDSVSGNSNYTTKTIGEKLTASQADPYDLTVDAEIPADFPLPDRHADGTLKDVAKETWGAISSLHQFPHLRAQEFEVTFGNLRLSLLRDENKTGDLTQSYLSQVSYVASFDKENPHFKKLVLSPSLDDLNNLLKTLSLSSAVGRDDLEGTLIYSSEEEKARQKLVAFFDNLTITALKTTDQGFRIPRSLFPEKGVLKGCGIVRNGKISKVIIPISVDRMAALQESFSSFGHSAILGEVRFGDGRPLFVPTEVTQAEVHKRMEFLLEPDVTFKARFLSDSLTKVSSLPSLQFEVETQVQNISLSGTVRYEQLTIAEATPKQSDPVSSALRPLWIHQDPSGGLVVPVDQPIGDGILIAKNFRDSGVRIGDSGFLSYYNQTTSGAQEQRLPIYVAGFYDPGFMAMGNKLILVDPKVTAAMRGNMTVADRMLGNGIQVWVPHLEDAAKVKEELIRTLEERGLGPYWTVESFDEYDFARPVLQQLKSDKTLFTLIAVIILIVACSNIISMLILLVNDKKREIGILQSMGASSMRIATIFGTCGFFTGLLSSFIGTAVALLTLKNLQSLVDFLSFMQGHQAFQAAFYGEILPNEVSIGALSFVLISTTLISLLAGIVPAIKAACIRPTEILRSE